MVQVSPIWFHLEPECALEGPGRPIWVPGEFQEVTVSAMPPNQRQPLVTPLPAASPTRVIVSRLIEPKAAVPSDNKYGIRHLVLDT